MSVDQQPSSYLVYPQIDESLETINEWTGITSWLSPASWLGWLGEKLLGQNPFEEASRMIAGDWKMVSMTGVAIGHLAEFNQAYANWLRERSGRAFPDHWTGKAATEAQNYFNAIEKTVRDQIDPLEHIASQIKSLTLAVNEAADLIKNLLEELADALITMGVGTYAKLGVVAVAGVKGYAAAMRATRLWRQIIEVYNKAVNIVKFLAAAIGGDGIRIQGMYFKSISSAGYDHQGVAPPRPKVAAQPPSTPATDPSLKYDGGFDGRMNPTVPFSGW